MHVGVRGLNCPRGQPFDFLFRGHEASASNPAGSAKQSRILVHDATTAVHGRDCQLRKLSSQINA